MLKEPLKELLNIKQIEVLIIQQIGLMLLKCKTNSHSIKGLKMEANSVILTLDMVHRNLQRDSNTQQRFHPLTNTDKRN